MSTTLERFGIDRLDLDERLALAEEIWASMARELEREPPPEPLVRELERRLADSLARPEAVTPWEVIKARALDRAR